MAITVSGYFYVVLIEQSFQNSIGVTASLLASEIMTDLDQKMQKRIQELNNFIGDASLRDFAIQSNKEFSVLENRQQYIQELDADWIAGKNRTEINNVLSNEISKIFQQKVSSYESDYGYKIFPEIFFTNEYGALIGSSGRTTDYDQSDEGWYEIGLASSEYYVEDVVYDETAEAVVIGIVIPLRDNDGNFIGMFKGYLDLENDLTSMIRHLESQSAFSGMKVNVVDNEGFAIFSEIAERTGKDIRLSEFGQKIPYFDDLINNADGNSGFVFTNQDGSEFLSAYAVSEGFGSYEGQGWRTLIDFDKAKIFSSFNQLKFLLLSVSLIISGIGIIIGLVITDHISKPISNLRKMAIEISKGNFDVKSEQSGSDEIKELSKVFDQMTVSLKKKYELEKQAIQAEERAKYEKLSAIGELSARVAHELRNPLHVIKTGLHLLRPQLERGDKSNKERLEIIDRAINRMTFQLNDVMDYIRQRPLELKQVNLSKIIQSAIERANVPSTVNIELPCDEVTIIADNDKLETVFSNLILNAAQAVNNRGKIKVRYNDEKMNDNVVIEVEDSGPGIPEKDVDKIFEPLYTTKQSGTGLGLSTCKNIVELHKGKISVRNNPTTFRVEFPKDGI